MLKKLSMVLVLGFSLVGAGRAAEGPTGSEPAAPTAEACATGTPAPLTALGVGAALPAAGGDLIFHETACCYSEPCASTGQPVGCCGTTCEAGFNWVACPKGGARRYCPTCSCTQEATCFDDTDCCPSAGGVCKKASSTALVGQCACL